VGDVLDPPRGRAEGEDVADPRLVHHLLVQLPHAPSGAVAPGEEHPEQPTVGDRAAGGDGEPLRAAAARERPGDPVPDHPGAQLRELVRRVAPAQHVQHRLQHRPAQPRERGRPSDEVEQVVDGPVLERAHSDDLLGEHVERVGRDPKRLDLPRAHALDDDSGLYEVAAELREQHAPRDRPHLMAGPTDPLQPGGDRGRRFDLDDEVDGAHVDAQLERRGGHDGGEPARLEVLLDDRPLLP
jgi:hypothetical protein